MSLWNKFGCLLTGWSYSTLKQCSEASRCQLSKYTSALMILILIWSVTGFCFAQRYIGLPVWGCAIVSLFFIIKCQMEKNHKKEEDKKRVYILLIFETEKSQI